MRTPARNLGHAFGACFVLLLSGCGDGTPVGPANEVNAEARAGGGRRHVIVLKEGVTADFTAAVERAGGKVVRNHRKVGVVTVRGLSAAAVAELRARPEIEALQPDVKVQWIPPTRQQMVRAIKSSGLAPGKATDQSGAQFFERFQWNMRVIKADQAWLGTNQGAGTLICILDTGIDPAHIDLAGKVDLDVSASFVADEAATQDLDGHGTFVAALASSNGLGMASVAPDAKLCAIKVLDQTGSGSFSDIIAGILYAAEIGADVANMSLGAYFSRKEEGARELIRAVQRALNFASRNGVLLVGSSGNGAVNLNKDPKDFIDIPSELNHVISVGATAPINQMNFDQIASYSNFGRKGVDVFAPGGDFVEGLSVVEDLIFSACSPSINIPEFGCGDGVTYLIGAGTSFSASHVSGEGAVIEAELSGDQDGARLTRCILKSADPVTDRNRDPVFNHGRINVLNGAECQAPPNEQVAGR